MDKIIITGGRSLHGRVKIAGSKNASLAILAASILNKEEVRLINVPNIADVTFMLNLLINLRCHVTFDSSYLDDEKVFNENILTINSDKMCNDDINYDFVSKMRASIFTLGPMLGRFGSAKISLPGGCAIGVRPVDLYIWALEQMGAKVELEAGYIVATALNGKLRAATIEFPSISNGATQCAMCAATLTEGQTVIKNASQEPEVVAVANFLNASGANITGHGTDTIIINGVKALHEVTYHIPPDRIEAGTYAVIAAVTNGELFLENCTLEEFLAYRKQFNKIGIGVELLKNNSIRCFRAKDIFEACDVETATYPGFPTDMQAQIITALCLTGKGSNQSIVTENIYENRFMHVAELNRMSANISINHHSCVVHGIDNFQGADVMATDLRASVSLIIAGLVANGKTSISRIYHLDRGYQGIVTKLKNCGANIERIRVN